MKMQEAGFREKYLASMLEAVCQKLEGLALVLRGEGSPGHSEDLRAMVDEIRNVIAALAASPVPVATKSERVKWWEERTFGHLSRPSRSNTARQPPIDFATRSEGTVAHEPTQNTGHYPAIEPARNPAPLAGGALRERVRQVLEERLQARRSLFGIGDYAIVAEVTDEILDDIFGAAPPAGKEG
jgi:hypothetical protein